MSEGLKQALIGQPGQQAINQSAGQQGQPTTTSDPTKAIDPSTSPSEHTSNAEASLKEDQAKNERVASRFAEAARREKAIWAKQKELKAKEDAIAAREKELEEYKRFKELKANPKANALKILEEFQLPYNDVTSAVLNDGKIDPLDEVRALRQELAEKEKRQEQERLERAKADRDMAVQGFVAKIDQEIQASKEKYKFIAAADEAAQLVYNIVDAYYQENKKVLPVEDAIQKADEWTKGQLIKAMELAKNLGLTLSTEEKKEILEEATTQAINATQPKNPTALRTLTNSLNGIGSPVTTNDGMIPKEESLRRASSMIKWT